MGGAVKNKEIQGNMKKEAFTRTETGCGYQSCRTVTCSVSALGVSPHLQRKDKQRPCHGSGISYRLLTTRTVSRPGKRRGICGG